MPILAPIIVATGVALTGLLVSRWPEMLSGYNTMSPQS